MAKRTTTYEPLGELVERMSAQNEKDHSTGQIVVSMDRFGYTTAVEVDERSGELAAGHGRVESLQILRDAGEEPPEGIEVREDGEWLVPTQRGWASRDEDELRAYRIANNKLVELGGWHDNTLAGSLTRLLAAERGLEGTGFTEEDQRQLAALLALGPGGDGTGGSGGSGAREIPPSLADRFGAPPFSVLDARQGYWQERKRQWLAMGIQSELGRPHNLLKMSQTGLEAQAPKASMPNKSVPGSHSGNDPSYFWKKQAAERQIGRPLTNEEFERDYYEPDAYVGGTSIFDPVLCELAYRWWAPPAARILDPFAGGSVRGIVAAALGHTYHGIDLSADQCKANEEQLAGMPALEGVVEWRHGDSLALLNEPEEPYDLVFSCPPYYDLEQYSDDPADLSNAPSYEAFLQTYAEIIKLSLARLRPDRFACFVVGDLRGEDGSYRGFVPDTIAAFESVGAKFYNEGILVTPVGSAALRAARIFKGGRKLVKSHQNVLVFVKGDWRKAQEACGTLEQGAAFLLPDLDE